MAVNNNADDYANARINIFFPGVTPDLDGQCVSLEKWFLGEMCGVSNWNAARGNAKDCGRTLVAQGLAYEVPYGERRRGDVVCLEYGTYGHVYIQLSGGRVFEENVNWSGTASKIVDGDRVYASRIGSDQEAWRIAAGKNPHVYRVKGYSEAGASGGGVQVAIIGNGENWYNRMNITHNATRGRDLDRATFASYVGKDFLTFVEDCEDDPEAAMVSNWQNVGKVAVNDKWDQQIYNLEDQVKAASAGLAQAQADLAAAQKHVDDLNTRPTQSDLDALTARLKVAQDNATKAQAALDDKLKQDAATDSNVNGFLRSLWKKLTGK